MKKNRAVQSVKTTVTRNSRIHGPQAKIAKAARPSVRHLPSVLVSAPSPSPFALEVAALYERLYNRALKLTRNPDRAGDLAQETVARALRFENKFQTGTNLHAWLQTMLGNLYLSEFRRAKFTGSVPAPIEGERGETDYFERLPDTRSATPEHSAVKGEIRAALTGALAELPRNYRWPLRMFLEEGRSYDEIAADLAIPIGTVMSRIFRARKLLQADLSLRLPGMVSAGAA